MRTTLSFEQAKQLLESLTDRYSLKEYVPGGKQSTLVDLVTSMEFTYQFGSLIYKLKRQPNYVVGSKRHNLQTAQQRLQSVTTRYEIVDFVPGKKALSTFRDVATGELRQANLNVVCNALKANPKYIISATPEELSEIRRRATKLPQILKDPATLEKIAATRKARGLTKTVEGKTLPEIAQEAGLSYAHVQQYVKTYGTDNLASFIARSSAGQSSIEHSVQEFLDSLNIIYVQNKQLNGTNFRPDFFIPSHNLVIECDGIYWHSDAIIKDKHYHVKKKSAYNNLGITSLFFREDELTTKPAVVQSIIANKLGINQRSIGARKTTVGRLDPSFFTNNHLMGTGRGRAFGLFLNGEPVCGMQVHFSKPGLLEISRYCTAPTTSVVGGFTKLLAHVKKEIPATGITTFIDLRYGSGSYLEDLGFVANKPSPSFKWVKNRDVVHRMQFPGNTGYDQGYNKLWDCGQLRYTIQWNT